MAQTSPGVAIGAIIAVIVVVVIVIAVIFKTKKQPVGFEKKYTPPIKNGSRLRIRSLGTGGYLQRDSSNICEGKNIVVCNATRANATVWTAYLCENCFIKAGKPAPKGPPREIINGSWLFYDTDGNTTWALQVPPKKLYQLTAAVIEAIPTLTVNKVPYSSFFALLAPSTLQGKSVAANGGVVFTSYGPTRTLEASAILSNSVTASPCAVLDSKEDQIDTVRATFFLEPI